MRSETMTAGRQPAGAWRWAALAGAVLISVVTVAASLWGYFRAPYMDMVDSELAASRALASPEPFSYALLYRSNEHLTGVAGVLTLLDRRYFAADGLFLVALMLLCAAGCAAILARMATPQGQSPLGRPLIMAGALFIVFAFPIVGANLFWPHQIELVGCVLFSVAALALMSGCTTESRGAALTRGLGAGALSVLATFSFGWGAATIPLLALAALAGPRKLEGLAAPLLPLAVLVARLATPAIGGVHGPGGESVLTGVLGHPLTALGYVSALTGSLISRALGGDKIVSLGLGAVGAVAMIGLSLCVLRRWWMQTGSQEEPERPLRFFALLGLWAVLAAALTAAGRLQFGVAQGFVARYTPLSAMLWFALAGLAAHGLKASWQRRAAAMFGGVIVVGLLAVTPATLIQQVRNSSAVDAAAAGIALGIDDPKTPLPLYPPGDSRVFELFGQLKADKASLYHRAWTGWIGQPLTSLFRVDGCSVAGGPLTAEALPGGGQRLSGPSPKGAPFGGEWILATDPLGVVRGLARDGLPLKKRVLGYAQLAPAGAAPIASFVVRAGKACRIRE